MLDFLCFIGSLSFNGDPEPIIVTVTQELPVEGEYYSLLWTVRVRSRVLQRFSFNRAFIGDDCHLLAARDCDG